MITVNQQTVIDGIIAQAEMKVNRETGLDVRLSLISCSQMSGKQNKWLLLRQLIHHLFGISYSKLVSPSRKAEIVKARFAYIYIGYKILGGKSLVDIGQELGGRDHTSIMHAVQAFDEKLKANEHYTVQVYSQIIDLLKSGYAPQTH